MRVIKTEKIAIKLWADNIDNETLRQAKNLANLPHAFAWISLMPDAHPGYGMPIGGVLATQGTVIPNAVGVDIGCGMIAVKTSCKEINSETLKKILGEIRREIPVGFKHHQKPQDWEGFKLAPESKIIQNELGAAQYQIGTLGGGNHFIEILKGSDGFIWLMLHSGSRNFGFRTANYYQQKALQLSERYSKDLMDKDLAFLPLDSKWGKEYLKAMNYCLAFAQTNREKMMEKVKKIFKHFTNASFFPPINIHHNYASIEKHFNKEVLVHRKGAVKAEVGQLGIIPGSMGSPSYITEGLGNSESFKSASHGAGRKLGRKEAIRTLNLEEEQAKMSGILGAPRTRNELQEAPGAYKDIDEVMKNQADLVKIKIKLTPLAVVTGN